MRKLSILTLILSIIFLFVSLGLIVVSACMRIDLFLNSAIISSSLGIATSITSIVCCIAAKNAGDL